jgi:hypothetical protein
LVLDPPELPVAVSKIQRLHRKAGENLSWWEMDR